MAEQHGRQTVPHHQRSHDRLGRLHDVVMRLLCKARLSPGKLDRQNLDIGRHQIGPTSKERGPASRRPKADQPAACRRSRLETQKPLISERTLAAIRHEATHIKFVAYYHDRPVPMHSDRVSSTLLTGQSATFKPSDESAHHGALPRASTEID